MTEAPRLVYSSIAGKYVPAYQAAQLSAMRESITAMQRANMSASGGGIAYASSPMVVGSAVGGGQLVSQTVTTPELAKTITVHATAPKPIKITQAPSLPIQLTAAGAMSGNNPFAGVKPFVGAPSRPSPYSPTYIAPYSAPKYYFSGRPAPFGTNFALSPTFGLGLTQAARETIERGTPEQGAVPEYFKAVAGTGAGFFTQFVDVPVELGKGAFRSWWFGEPGAKTAAGVVGSATEPFALLRKEGARVYLRPGQVTENPLSPTSLGTFTALGLSLGLPKALGSAKEAIPFKAGEAFGYRGIYFRPPSLATKFGFGDLAHPLIGVSEGKVVLGVPRINLKALPSEAYVNAKTKYGLSIGSALEYKVAKANIGVEAGKLAAVRQFAPILEKQGSAFVSKSFPAKTKTLPPAGINLLLKSIRKEGGEIFGSYGAAAQMRAPRPPADVDVMFTLKPKSGVMPEEFASNLVIGFKKLGIPARISKESPTLIETNLAGKGAWPHAVDVHAAEELLSTKVPEELRQTSPPTAYGLKLEQPKKVIAGIKTDPLSLQFLKKAESATRVFPKGSSVLELPKVKYKVGPVAHRLKDVGDVLKIGKELVDSRRTFPRSLTTIGALTRRAEAGLKQFEIEFKDLLPAEPKNAPKLLASFAKPSAKPSLGLGIPRASLALSSKPGGGYRSPSLKPSPRPSKPGSASPKTSTSPSIPRSPSSSLSLPPSKPSSPFSGSPSTPPSPKPSAVPSLSLAPPSPGISLGSPSQPPSKPPSSPYAGPSLKFYGGGSNTPYYPSPGNKLSSEERKRRSPLGLNRKQAKYQTIAIPRQDIYSRFLLRAQTGKSGSGPEMKLYKQVLSKPSIFSPPREAIGNKRLGKFGRALKRIFARSVRTHRGRK